MKKYIFVAFTCLMVLVLCGSASAAEMPDNNQVYLDVSNDNGAYVDVYGNDTYYFMNGTGTGGTNALRINLDGSQNTVNTFTTNQSGTFYLATRGGKGYIDSGILMLAVNGSIPDNFQVTINAGGYTWTPKSTGAPLFSEVTYNANTLTETFYRSDFIYGPQTWKPYFQADYPLYEKQDMTNTSNKFYIMLIDLYAGMLSNSSYSGMQNNGAIKIDYSFQNLPLDSLAAFNGYGYMMAPETGLTEGHVGWTTRVNTISQTSTDSNGYYVTGTAPTAAFTATPTSGTAPLNVQFTDQSTGSPTSWAWDFNNDGTVDSTAQNPSYTYSTAGTYTVKLTATNAGGSNEEIKTDYIMVNYAAPVANFVANTTSGTAPLAVHFTDQSTDSVTGWSWDFNNDGTIDSTQQNPDYIYSTAGTYTVKLTVTGPGGSNVITKTSYITVTNNSDTSAPRAGVDNKGGLFNTNKKLILWMSEPGTIYYTLNGSTPTTSSNKYTGPIIITATTTLKFMAVDMAGNPSGVYTEKYIIDKVTPKVAATKPLNYSTRYSRTGTIAFRLSENIKSSVNWSKIHVKNLATGKKVLITKWISGSYLYIKTGLRFKYRWYQVYVPAGAVKDVAGNNAAAFTIKFKTGG